MTLLQDYRRLSTWMGIVMVLAGGWFAAGTAQATPVVERISFAPSIDGQGYVVRIHTTERLHAMGVTVAVFNQSANVPNEGDYLSVMRRNVESLADALQGN